MGSSRSTGGRSSRARMLVAITASALALLAIPSIPSIAAGARTPAQVRVNQIGYDVHGPKRAYVMSSVSFTGKEFSVVRTNGHVVYTGPIGQSAGAWSDTYGYVFPLDFGAVSTPGTYRIVAPSGTDARSPVFRIATGADLYRQALVNALSFYQDERDGPNYVPSALRTAPAHLNDRNAMTYVTPKTNSDGNFKGRLQPLGVRVNAAGGWWDAGDYPKFIVTTSYTVDLLLAGVRDFPNQMGGGASGSDFTSEARFGLNFLMRMWDDRTRTLYYQVGIGSGSNRFAADHDIWRLPQRDDAYHPGDPAFKYIRHRPVFRAGPPGSKVSPNLAGRDAAAFALGYQLFHESQPKFARRCLLAAEHIFALANRHPTGRLLTVVPFGFYPEKSWTDDMELGATELYFALASGGAPANAPQRDPLVYLRAAAKWAHAYMTGPGDAADTLNLYDTSGFAHYDLVRAIRAAGNPSGLATTPDALLGDMRKELDNAEAQGATDPFGFGFGWAHWDTTTHGAGLSVEASEYDQLTGTHRYSAESRRWLANILGANAWGSSFIVGDGTTFPHCMQHQVANIVGSRDGSPPILAGAAVEGPNSYVTFGRLQHMRHCPADRVDQFAQFNGFEAVYKDNVQSYDTVEPAIDLTASSPLAFARQSLGLS
jgi:endoglucanase